MISIIPRVELLDLDVWHWSLMRVFAMSTVVTIAAHVMMAQFQTRLVVPDNVVAVASLGSVTHYARLVRMPVGAVRADAFTPIHEPGKKKGYTKHLMSVCNKAGV